MAPDMVNHPPHYETNGIECIDAMRASQGDEATKNFCVCNAFKYIWRSTHKGSEIQDLEKAIWYLNKAIEIGKGESSVAYRCKKCGLLLARSVALDEDEVKRHLVVDHHYDILDGISTDRLLELYFDEITF